MCNQFSKKSDKPCEPRFKTSVIQVQRWPNHKSYPCLVYEFIISQRSCFWTFFRNDKYLETICARIRASLSHLHCCTFCLLKLRQSLITRDDDKCKCDACCGHPTHIYPNQLSSGEHSQLWGQICNLHYIFTVYTTYVSYVEDKLYYKTMFLLLYIRCLSLITEMHVFLKCKLN